MDPDTTSDFRMLLMEDYILLRTGRITRAEANTRARVARNIVSTFQIEIAAQAMNLDRFRPVLLDRASGAKPIAAE